MIHPAGPADATRVEAFGHAHVPPHYEPVIGAEDCAEVLRLWWAAEVLAAVAETGDLLLAEDSSGALLGVAEHGLAGEDHVMYKLYLAPEVRGRGLGPRLISALEDRLPVGTERLVTEHYAGNTRAAAFYAREGFEEIRTDPDPSGLPERATVWRARTMALRA